MENPVKRFLVYLHWLYFQFQIHLGLNELDTWEVTIFNTVLIVILSCTVYTTCIFLPPHLAMWGRVFSSLSKTILNMDTTDTVAMTSSSAGNSLTGANFP